MNGKRLSFAAGDPWIDLTVAVVQRAIDDMQGRRLLPSDQDMKEIIRAEAQTWLRAEAVAIVDDLGIAPAAMIEALRL